MTEPQGREWHPPDAPAGWSGSNGHRDRPPGALTPPPHPAVAPPQYARPPVPPPAGWRPGMPPGPWGRPAPRRVAPPVPVPDARDDGPPPPPMQLPPKPGYQSPAPRVRQADRVPGDLPFVIRPRLRRWVLLFFVGLVVVTCVSTTLALVWGGLTAALLALGWTLLGYTLLCGFVIYTQASGGPLLAADRDGVWIRARKWPVKAVQLPWELIAEVRSKRWFLEKVLCVIPRDDRVGRFSDLWSAGDQLMNTAYFGTPFTASVVYGDVPERDALRKLADLSAGRARVASRPTVGVRRRHSNA